MILTDCEDFLAVGRLYTDVRTDCNIRTVYVFTDLEISTVYMFTHLKINIVYMFTDVWLVMSTGVSFEYKFTCLRIGIRACLIAEKRDGSHMAC